MARRRKSRSTNLLADSLLVAVAVLAIGLILLPLVWKIAVIAVFALAIAIYVGLHFRRLNQWRQLGIDRIDRMEGAEFERRLWLLFKDLGYDVQATPVSGDWGADLIVTKDGVRTVVQAKRYSKPVGLQAVQEAVTACAKYNCRHSIVVTNNTFTPQARELAWRNGTELWDRQRLLKELKRVSE